MTTVVSTASAQVMTRTVIGRLQSDLSQAQQELSSGRHGDIGLTLGYRSGLDASLRAQIATKAALIDTDSYLTTRFSALDGALNSLMKIGQSLQEALVATSVGGANAYTIGEQARAALKQAVSIVNMTFDGSYLFAGSGDNGSPLNEASFDAVEASDGAVGVAFQARFGTKPGDAAASSISGDDMQSFLEKEFSLLFEAEGWNASWTNASGVGDEFRIMEAQSLTSPSLATSSALRNLMKSLTMLSGLGLPSLASDARGAVVATATSTLGQSIRELTALSADVGLKSTVVRDASKQLEAHKAQLQKQLDDMETVDPAEVSVRLSTLSTQLQASYQVTAKLADLSLVKFI